MAINKLTSSTLRLTGLASGLDTESIVKSLLDVDRLKVDRQQRLVTKLGWQGDAHRAVNLQLKNFREKYMRTLSSDNLLSAKAYNVYNTTLSKETSAVKITAGSGATAGAYTINSIERLASAASFSSAKLGESVSINTKLSDLTGIDFEITTIPGEEQEDGSFSEPTEIRSLSFSINGQSFTFNSNTMLSEVMSAVNSNAKAGVTMNYSSLKQSLTITGSTTGASSAVKIENGKGNLFGVNSVTGIENGERHGENAKLTIEGVEVERSSNAFTIDGITYSLKETSLNTAIKFEVERDVGAVVNKIASFIDSYNELIVSLQDKLKEDVHSAYEPLTDTERDQLSEKQAEQWEEKAKSGLLKGNSKLSNLLSTLRTAFYTSVESAGLSPSEIGLTTGNYGDGGKIVLNKDKLREAIEQNPTRVANLFTASSSSTDLSVKNSESGLISRISTAMSSYISFTTSETLDLNSKELNTATSKLSDLETWLSDNEENYYKRFSAMETALAKLNSQTGWISALLGGSN